MFGWRSKSTRKRHTLHVFSAAAVLAKNCDCGPGTLRSGSTAQLLTAKSQRITYEGRDTIVVPVIMVRSGVVMNDALIPEEEIVPASWNGVPVTINHPQLGGEFTTANSPSTLSEWACGRIFNAEYRRGSLRAEAWIDVERAEAMYPGLTDLLESRRPMDVSTGFFSRDENQTGYSNGRRYSMISRDIKPDHLALLPEEDGACSWDDGCGVRNNKQPNEPGRLRSTIMQVRGATRNGIDHVLKAVMARVTKGPGVDEAAHEKARQDVFKQLREAFATEPDATKGAGKIKAQERGDEDDARQIIADLISNDDSPFVPDDEDSLRMMSPDTLGKMRDQYLKAREEDDPEKEEPKTEVKEDEKDPEEEKKAMTAMTADGMAKLIQEAVTVAVKAATASMITDRDRVALAQANKIADQHRATLIAKVVANSTITQKQAEGFDLATLEVIAGGLHPAPNYAGQPIPAGSIAVNVTEDVAAQAMSPVSTLDAFRAKKAGKGGVSKDGAVAAA